MPQPPSTSPAAGDAHGAGHPARFRLDPRVAIAVTVDDGSPFGSPLSDVPDRHVRELFEPVLRAMATASASTLLAAAAASMGGVVASEAFRSIADLHPDPDGWTLHEDVRYPDADRVRFSGLVLTGPDGQRLEVRVPSAEWPAFHSFVSALTGAAQGQRSSEGAPADDPAAQHVAATLEALVQAGWVERVEPADDVRPESRVPPGDEPGVFFGGHNLVAIRSREARVVVDPLLTPPVATDSSGYRALSWRELGPVDAVLLTHSHPDHFAPGSLLQIDPATTIIVPRVERESILSVAIGRRLRELGFTDVVELDWEDSTRVGDIVIHALPFYGEQPTDGPVLHPEIRNAGSTYLVQTPELSVALLADSGRDHLGDVRDLASATRERLGPVDVVFCGYRGWRTYPAQLLHSSVSRYVLFVPPSMWGARMCLMNDLDDVIDVAERWGARVLVPYADGGAPWFWSIGLGPRLDDEAFEIEGFDPFPERVLDAAATRVRVPRGEPLSSPVDVRLLRPNDALVGWAEADGPHLQRLPGNSWPY